MKLTNRQKSILLFLNNQTDSYSKNEVTGKTIADNLNISLRTLQNEVKNINSSFDKKVIESNHNGYYINSNVESIHVALSEDYLGRIFKQLLFENCPLNIDELAETYYVSASTLQNGIRNLNNMISQNNLHISKKNNCIFIDGTESGKQRVIHSMIMREIGFTNDTLEIASSYLKNLNIVETQSIILSAIDKNNFYIEPCYTANLMINILIALSRIHDRHSVEKIQLKNYNLMPEFKISKNICTEVEKRFNFTFNENDIKYLTSLMIGQIKSKGKSDTSLVRCAESNILMKIIKETFEHYMLDINYETLIPSFIRHLQAMLIRAKNKQSIINLISPDIKETCPFVYDIAVHLAKSIEDKFDITIGEEEIGLLCIYIGFIIEQSDTSSGTVRALVVCNDYLNLSSKLIEKIKQTHGKRLEIIAVIKNPAMIDKYKNIELIIHLIPINVLGPKAVFVSPFYTEDDSKKVGQAIEAILEKKKKDQYKKLLLKYFSENLYFKNMHIKEKEGAIRFLGGQVEKNRLCEKGFTQSVLERESMSSTCFLGTFAIPHAIDLNAKKTQICVLIEENGIKWDRSIIKYVFMITVSREDRKEFMEIYSGIIRILCDNNSIKSLEKAKDFDSFIDCFTQS